MSTAVKVRGTFSVWMGGRAIAWREAAAVFQQVETLLLMLQHLLHLLPPTDNIASISHTSSWKRLHFF